jgi:mono/diheme cytochrome c family protein
MKRFPSLLIRVMQILAVAALFYGVFVGVAILVGEQPAHALPEYTGRTGESCGTCHVSAGGGGPRTLRGLLWSARGKPDAIPDLPGSLLAPGVADGLELYDIACAGCHGFTGEGLFAINLVGNGASRATNRSFILRGIPNTDMPSFEGQLTEEQIEILVDFVTGMSRGAVELPEEYPLPRPELKCEPFEAGSACGGK